MYTIDELDTVVPLSNVPQSDVGADDYRLVLEYRVTTPDPNWDGTYVNVVSTETEGTVALVRFRRPYAHMMGAPNEEAIAGHPLAARGLEPFAAFEIRDSSWIRALESMNSVHPYHDRARFLAPKRHFIFVFHDSTFECVAEGFDVSVLNASILDSIETVVGLLREDPI